MALLNGVNTHHGDVPGAYLCEVSHQVLPRQQTLHVYMQHLPHGNHLLMTCIQTREGQECR